MMQSEEDYIVPMPPKESHIIELKVTEIKRGKPSIAPNITTKEARAWLSDLVVFIFERADMDDDLVYRIDTMKDRDIDDIFNYAIERLLE